VGLLAHDERPKLQEFVRSYWGRDHVFVRDPAVFDWQHKGPRAYHCMAARQGAELVGIQGVIPLKHFDGELPGREVFFGMWRALEDRGIGIGLRLYKAILKEYQPDFIGSLGIEPRVIGLHQWQGFTVSVMNHHVALSPFVREFKIATLPDGLVPPARRKASSASFQKLSSRDLDSLPTERLYAAQSPRKSNVYVRNHFLDHPVYTYEVYGMHANGALQAMCVVRAVAKGGAIALRVVDFMGPNEAVSWLGGLVTELLAAYGAEYADLYSCGIPPHLLEAAAFIDRRATPGLIVPNWFEPFTNRNIDIVCARRTSGAAAPPRLFKADGDQERPNSSTRAAAVQLTVGLPASPSSWLMTS